MYLNYEIEQVEYDIVNFEKLFISDFSCFFILLIWMLSCSFRVASVMFPIFLSRFFQFFVSVFVLLSSFRFRFSLFHFFSLLLSFATSDVNFFFSIGKKQFPSLILLSDIRSILILIGVARKNQFHFAVFFSQLIGLSGLFACMQTYYNSFFLNMERS